MGHASVACLQCDARQHIYPESSTLWRRERASIRLGNRHKVRLATKTHEHSHRLAEKRRWIARPSSPARSTSLRRYRSISSPTGVVRSFRESLISQWLDPSRRERIATLTWKLPALDGVAGRGEVVEEQLSLRRLAGPVETLQDDEEASNGR